MIVANIQMKNLKIEAEKGFRRTLFEPELVDPNLEINFVNGAEAAVKSRNVNSRHPSSIEREIV